MEQHQNAISGVCVPDSVHEAVAVIRHVGEGSLPEHARCGLVVPWQHWLAHRRNLRNRGQTSQTRMDNGSNAALTSVAATREQISTQEQLLDINVRWFRGGLVFKARHPGRL